MSEFTNNYERRATLLGDYLTGLLNGENGLELIDRYQIKTEAFMPKDVMAAFDIVMNNGADIEALKTVSNKLFNILFETLNGYPAIAPAKNSFLYYMIEDNNAVKQQMNNLKVTIKNINATGDNTILRKELTVGFIELEQFAKHYVVVENVLFPYMEKAWNHHRCVQLMWSFHDDIRRNLKAMIEMLRANSLNLKEFNKLVGTIFFNISTIILREEKIIYPTLIESATPKLLDTMLHEVVQIGLPYATPAYNSDATNDEEAQFSGAEIHTSTGSLRVEQFIQIFKHLPVDITFVDENDEVRFFSNPPHRVFPRTPAIIGRKVQFCHPPESVHIVNKILDDFKAGREECAPFWINMRGRMILIEYYALRDDTGKYMGTLEVSQDITRYRELEGEQRLLSYKNGI